MFSCQQSKMHQDQPVEEDNTPNLADSQLYEEIKDLGPEMSAKQKSTEARPVLVSQIEGMNQNSSEAYQVTLCSAYGVSLNK